jgi:cell division inhibitor SepF
MAGGMRRLMEYLGLNDGPYEDDYEYEDQVPEAQQPAGVRPRPGPSGDEPGTVALRPVGPTAPGQGEQSGGVKPIPRPVQRLQPTREQRVHVVEPVEFGDGQEIADRIKDGQPVVVSIVETDNAVGRRIIDFCSAVAYMSSGKMQRIAAKVFLLTPANVEVSDAEKRRLQERGLYQREI